MPNRTLTYLGASFGGMVAIYIALVIATIFLANWQTEMVSRVNDAEASIGMLEAEYYEAIARVNAEDPAQFGFVRPAKKEFARAADAPSVTRAGE